MPATLPVEMWTEIVHYLPLPRHMLHVSRLLHDIVIRRLFSTLKIYFMHGEPGFFMLNTENERYVRETSDYLLNRSWELLHCIITNPAFASAVKTLSVHAFTDGPAVFEHRTLAQALKSLPNLRSFHYFGDCPDFSAVAACLPRGLKTLRIQSMPNSTLLSHLDSLRFLQPAIPFIYVREQKLDRIFAEWDRGSGDPRDLVPVLESNPIHELVLLSTHIVLLPIRVCNTLTRLDICVPQFEELVGLDLVFRHAQFLESLSLVGYIEPPVFADLPKDPAVLPRLTSFRISCEFWDQDATEMHVPLLSEFLSRRPSLRRLYIRLPGVRLEVALAIATVIGKLEGLWVLGFHAGYEPLYEAAALHLADQLSTKLEALQLALPWYSDLHVRTWYPLLNKLQQFPNLSFLHLFSNGEDPVPISPVELATDLEHLQLVGIQRSLWTVDREAGEELEPKLWTPWAVKYCLPEDFPCADHAWLFRYH
ncbi:hypothetical protein DFH08DRAFT_695377 [Mycena albidolilacea]|uniref:F-box domain-containing protein n=1 Tax=Mycena albidolilacea TaxID=1033008 RepID=A0AAD7EVH7_9AGAR|nr:hypothetical protein DFH08DRAFT_695377 [Mycena albidolilacea]